MAFFSANSQNLVLLEDFLVENAQTISGRKSLQNFSLNPEEIKKILMNSPKLIDNIDNAIEFLMKSSELFPDKNFTQSILSSSNFSFVNLQTKLATSRFLSENRILHKENQIIRGENAFSIKKIESIITDNEAIIQEVLVCSYSILMMIVRSEISKDEFEINYSFEKLNQLIEFYKKYSISSTFSPISTNSIKYINENMKNDSSIFIGFPSGSPNIFKRGVVSNGNFIFMLHSDFHLSIFPIIVENGGFLSPITLRLRIDSNFESAELSLVSENLILSLPQSTFCFEIQSLINSPHLTIIEIPADDHYLNWSDKFTVSDGVVNVTVCQEKELIIATVKTIDSQKIVNKVSLHKNKDESIYEVHPFEDCSNLFSWPVETNGLVLSFYIKIDQNHLLCRQFSLIDGSHLRDEMIETNINIASITYDSINQMHYVAIETNGKLIMYGLSGTSNCCVNPAIFKFSFPDLNQNFLTKQRKFSLFQTDPNDEGFFKYEQEFIYLMNSILLSSILFKKDINTFIISQKENINTLIEFINEIAQSLDNEDINNADEKEIIMSNIKLASLQILTILLVINIRHQNFVFNENEEDLEFQESSQKNVIDMLLKFSNIKKSYSMSIVSFIFLNIFDIIDFTNNKQYLAILEGLLISSTPTLLKYIIHVSFMNSAKFSVLSFTNPNNIFSKYIVDSFPLSDVHENIISFLLAHQRCIINQLHISLKKEFFSISSLIMNINYNDCKTDNEALNNFGEYTNFLINQFTNTITNSSSFDDIKKTTVYFLFTNYLYTILGLYKYHEVAQIVTPLLHIIQNSLKNFVYQKKIVLLNNKKALDVLINVAIPFGSFAGTLIKGGNYSMFDEKYKWLIRPNMRLAGHPEMLLDLDNPETNIETYIDPNVRLFLSSSEDESVNGKNILQDIYKKWNVSMNKNLKSPYIELDQLFFAVELYHLNLFDALEARDLAALRPALQQMMRVRNAARSILRSKESDRSVQIILESDDLNLKKNKKSDIDELNSYYSPFDLIVIKCKMLLRLTSKFDDSNISNAPKLLADFVLSPEQPSSFINYISNQRNRLQLTNIGFSLIESFYSQYINELFLQIVDASLSIAIDNFDGLSAIIQYDFLHKSETYISNFLLRSFKSMYYPYLSMIAYKLIKSEVLPKEIIGNILKQFISISIKDNKLFCLFYKRYSCIEDIFSNSKMLLSLKSDTVPNVSFDSLPEEDFDKISSDDWYIISDVFSKQAIDPSIYHKVLHFFLQTSFNVQNQNLEILNYVSNCIYSFYENCGDLYSAENIESDFILFLDSLGKSMKSNNNLERASSIVMILRKVLDQKQKNLSDILIKIFNKYGIFKITSYEKDEYDEKICAIFAILGGFVDVIKPYCSVSIRLNREQIHNGILLNSKEALLLPINEETKPIDISNYKVYPKPFVPFCCSMFSDYNFIISFMQYATNDLTCPIAYIYLNSLSYYLKDEDFNQVFSDENANYLIQKLSPVMNPFDTLKDTENLFSLLSSMKKIESSKENPFLIMSNDICTTYLSPVLKDSKANVIINSDTAFNGYYGIVADYPLESQFPYAIVHSDSGIIYPYSINTYKTQIKSAITNFVQFTVDPANNCLYITNGKLAEKQLKINVTKIDGKPNKYRIFICVLNSCHVKSIKVCYPGSRECNTSRQFDFDYEPCYNTLYEPCNMNDLIKYPPMIAKRLDEDIRYYLNFPARILINFPPFTNVSYNNRPLFEMVENQNILFQFTQANAISENLKNYIFSCIYIKMTTQISTIIIMQLVNNGFGDFLYDFNSSFLIKLFSYLQIPLESFNSEKLCNNEFPFNFKESILQDNSLSIHNQQFNNLEFEMIKCLNIISRINQNEGTSASQDFKEELKLYIKNLANDSTIHTLRNIKLNTRFYDLKIPEYLLKLTLPKYSEAMIVSTPFLSCFENNIIKKYENSQYIPMKFPFILNANKNDNCTEITINVLPLQITKKNICTLMINKYDNNWVFGTGFELLLLLKEYYRHSKDHVFLRETLIDLILMKSPFVYLFATKLLVKHGQDCFLIPSQYSSDYLKKLYLLVSRMRSDDNYIDQSLNTFINHENRALNNRNIGKLAPFFPEFFGESYNIEFKPDAKLEIDLENLDIQNQGTDPVDLLMMYSQLVNPEDQNKDNYLDIFLFWLSISAFYLNNSSKKNDAYSLKDAIILQAYKPRKCEFYPSRIHDVFFNEIKEFNKKWTKEAISDFVSCIPQDILLNTSFMPLYSFVTSKRCEFSSFALPRILLLMALAIHRINYLFHFYQSNIQLKLFKNVIHALPFNEISQIFLKDVAVKNVNSFYLYLNRFEAHQISFEGSGKQSRSMIAQVSKILAKNPTYFRQIEKPPWEVKFANEKGVDLGGLARELFVEISSSIIDPTSGLFILSPNGREKEGPMNRDVYIPFHSIHSFCQNKIIEISKEDRVFCYQAIGVFLGIVIRTGYIQDLPFAPLVWESIAGQTISESDVFSVDEPFKRFILNLRNAKHDNELFDSLPKPFVWECEDWDGTIRVVNNPTNSKVVLKEHLDIFVANCIRMRIDGLMESINHIRNGFYENIGFYNHPFMTGNLLSKLSQGSNKITIDDLKPIVIFKYQTKNVEYFWYAVEKMNDKQRSLLLKFITGLTRIPKNDSKFIIIVVERSGVDRLPEASTCFYTLTLPRYSSAEMAYKMILIAIETCSTIEII